MTNEAHDSSGSGTCGGSALISAAPRDILSICEILLRSNGFKDTKILKQQMSTSWPSGTSNAIGLVAVLPKPKVSVDLAEMQGSNILFSHIISQVRF